MLKELSEQIYENACNKGWHENPISFGDAITNIHGELSEAWEDYRNKRGLNETYYEGNKPCGIPTELADVIIRVLDTCQTYGIDIEEAIKIKMDYNKTREYKHGGKRV